MKDPSVQIVIVDLGATTDILQACSASIAGQNYNGDVSCPIVQLQNDEPGGTMLSVIKHWIKSDAEYVGFCGSNYISFRDRIARQLGLMGRANITATYTDVDVVSSPPDVTPDELYTDASEWVTDRIEYAEFDPEMLGFNFTSGSTVIFKKKALEDAGAFQHLIAASYKPEVFLLTMAASRGQIVKLPGREARQPILTAKLENPLEAFFDKYGGILSWTSENKVKEYWRNLRFEAFVRDVRQIYKTNRWPV